MKLSDLARKVQYELDGDYSNKEPTVEFDGDRMIIRKGYVDLVIDSDGREVEIYNE